MIPLRGAPPAGNLPDGKTLGRGRQDPGGGTRYLQEAVLFRAASSLFRDENRPDFPTGAVGVIDFSASGYVVVTAGGDGDDNRPRLLKNPACGAGSGVNLRRVLDKLDIAAEDVDRVLAPYLGADGAALRRELPVRTERCGVFSVSATVSEKNQGIPTAHALAVTMKSEVAKPCSRVPDGVRTVHLTGGVFRWQFMRDCAADDLRSRSIEEIRYDEGDSLMLLGLEDLAGVGGHFTESPRPCREGIRGRGNRMSGPNRLLPGGGFGGDGRDGLPSFRTLHNRFVKAGRYVRLPEGELLLPEKGGLAEVPVNIAMDMGSSVAKMVIADALSGETLYWDALPNRGDALQTVRRFFDVLGGVGVDGLWVQNWGLTGSGRYQIGQILKAVYPTWGGAS